MFDFDISEMEEIMANGFADVQCDHCGYEARVEPDCSDECPECGEGTLESPLVTHCLI